MTSQRTVAYMAFALLRANGDQPGPVAASLIGGGFIQRGSMAEATIDPLLAEISLIRADLGMILARSAQRFGSKPALIAGGRTLTYGELHELCGQAAGGLHALRWANADPLKTATITYADGRTHPADRASAYVTPTQL